MTVNSLKASMCICRSMLLASVIKVGKTVPQGFVLCMFGMEQKFHCHKNHHMCKACQNGSMC